MGEGPVDGGVGVTSVNASADESRRAPSARLDLTRLIPLFLVSLGVVGIENALTRFFAVAAWSDYGYWIISMVMAGFALSGVAVALFRETAERIGPALRLILPALMVLTAAFGFLQVTVNPFNPLQLQNPTTWTAELRNIALYYGALLPFFFLAGAYISVFFFQNHARIGKVYGYDLIGAAVGALVALLLMFWLHPFVLIPALIVPVALAPLFEKGRFKWLGVAGAMAALVAGEYMLFTGPAPAFSQYKAIYAPMHTAGADVEGQVRAPRGYYILLDAFTERVDADLSNNAQMLGVPGPPSTLGLYRDGSRIAALPLESRLDGDYARAGLSAGPYVLRPGGQTLLIGLSGGWRAAEAIALGAGQINGVEPEPLLRRALEEGLETSPAPNFSGRVTLLDGGPVGAALAAPEPGYDIIDISADFIDTTPANMNDITVEAFQAYLGALRPDGVLSVSVSIRDFPVYALRVLATAREALIARGVDPSQRILVYRSAWNARILISPDRWTAEDIAELAAFCEERSFDLSYAPGLDIVAQRARLFNDLPSVDFLSGEITSTGPDDALANEIPAVLAGQPTPTARDFHVRPATLDRPAYYSSLRLENLPTLIQRLEVLPQAEIGGMVNLAVLGQAMVIAVLVLAAPLLFRKRAGKPEPRRLWPALYFPCLGLGFLLVEILIIDKAAFYLNDYSTAFALVVTSMLFFSGVGSLIAGHVSRWPKLAVALSVLAVLAWSGVIWIWADAFLIQTLDLPTWQRGGLIMAAAAPLALALGVPFPMGLTQVGEGRMLPWAWALNGAFSVIATPLANLLSRDVGFSSLLVLGASLYILAFIVLPTASRRPTPESAPLVEEPA